MKKRYIYLLLCIIASCNYKDSSIILYPDSTNYDYKRVSKNLIKVIRFFPKTQDTSVIFFYNNKNNLKDSIASYFNTDNELEETIEYKNGMNTKILKEFNSKGIIKRETKFINDLRKTVKIYYDDGAIKVIYDFVHIYKKELVNNSRIFKKNGELDKDKTFFVELMLEKDTISISDSIKLIFNLQIPKETLFAPLTGNLDENFNIIDSTDLCMAGKNYYYKPKKTKINFCRVIFEINTEPKKENPLIYKTFLEKEIYVTE